MAKLEHPLYSQSLVNLKGERWKDIKGFEGYYQLSNYGRIKSLARWIDSAGKRKPYFRNDRIRKLTKTQRGKEGLDNIQVTLHRETSRYTYSIARLVYHYFVKPIDFSCHTFVISRKDGNYYNCHYTNLEKRTISEIAKEGFAIGKRKSIFQDQIKAVHQYSIEGKFIATFKTVKEASEKTGIPPNYISGAAREKVRPSRMYYWRYGKAKEQINVKPLLKRLQHTLRCQPKKVKQYTMEGKYIQTFTTMGAAAKSVSMQSPSGIAQVCMGRQKSCKGYIWKYVK